MQHLRDSGLANSSDPIAWSPDPFSPFHYGTWAADDVDQWPFEAPARDMPVAGVSRQLASDYCHANGAELPSEAQFEYVAGGLSNRTFIWGNDDPTCEDAVWGWAAKWWQLIALVEDYIAARHLRILLGGRCLDRSVSL